MREGTDVSDGMEEHWVELAEFPTRDEARIVVGMLRSNGVDALDRFDDAGGAYPQLASRAHGGTTVLVPAPDLERARALAAPEPWPQESPDAAARRRRLRRGGLLLIFLLWGLPVLMVLVDELTSG